MDTLMYAARCQKWHKIYTTLDLATSVSVFLADMVDNMLPACIFFKLLDLCIFNHTLSEGYRT